MILVACFTPLQVIIAKEVLLKENVDFADVFFIYFSTIKDRKHLKYYSRISNLVGKSLFITEPYSAKLLLTIKRKISIFNYSQIFLASLDDSITHYLLSYCHFNDLITFDDGVGNIFPKGSYFISSPRKTLKKKLFTVVHSLLGRHYYLDDVKAKSSKHYTIYSRFDNCIKNAEYFPLFKLDKYENVHFKGVKNIVLGTVFSEVFARDGSLLKSKLVTFMKELKPAPVFIAHPRANDNEFLEFDMGINDIAEDYIIELLTQGFEVNVYGFASSCQFNFLDLKNVNIYIFNCQNYKPNMKEAINMLDNILPDGHMILM